MSYAKNLIQWTAEESGFDCREGQDIFLLSIISRSSLGLTQPPVQWLPISLSPGLKRQGRKADHSPPSSVEVKNCGAIPALPHTFSWCDA
jgi:hypothetical protein